MPQINRIRVNNINYNDGTQRYDDFLMNFNCKNALYDLVNGGGKSILLMLILQTVLPNQELDKKQPLSKLFISSNNNNTIHSMVEWKLDKEAKERFRANYLLTGFCAKKGSEGKGEVEYFNYIINYAGYNDNDIKNFELVDNKDRINYSNMRKKLRSMQDEGNINCHVELFETNDSYKRRLAEYGIYESHWNIVRGINESEGHVRAYIEKNYKTSRQLIDKLLIDEIIEKANKVRIDGNNSEDELADSLLEIQDKLMELSRKKKDKEKYERQVELIESFIDKLNNYEQNMCEKENLVNEYRLLCNKLEKNCNYVNNKNDELKVKYSKHLNEKNAESQIIELLTIKNIENELIKLKERLDILKKETKELFDYKSECNTKLLLSQAKKSYLKYKNAYMQNASIQSEIKHKQENTKDGLKYLQVLTAIKKVLNDKKIESLSANLNENTIAINKIKESYQRRKDELDELNRNNGSNNLLISQANENVLKINNQIVEISKEIEKIADYFSDNNILIKDEDRKAKYETKLIEFNKQVEINKNNLQSILEENSKLNNEKTKLEVKLEYAKSQKDETAISICSYDQQKVHIDNIKNVLKLDETIDTSSMLNYLHVEENEEHKRLYECTHKCENISRKMVSLREGKINVDNADLETVFNYISKITSSTELGSEYIKSLDLEERNIILNKFPIILYAVVVDDTVFAKVSKNVNSEKLYLDSIIPVISKKAIEDFESIDNNNIFYAHSNAVNYCSEEYFFVEADRLEVELTKLLTKKRNHEENIMMYKKYISELEEYINKYDCNIIEWQTRKKDNELFIENSTKRLDEITTRINVIEEEKENLKYVNDKIEEEKIFVERMIDYFISRINLNKEKEIIENNLRKYKTDYEKCVSEIEVIKNKSDKDDADMEIYKANIVTIKQNQADIIKQWNEKYNKYFETEIYINICNKDIENLNFESIGIEYSGSMSQEDVSSELEGAISAYERENANVLDQFKICKVYQDNMTEFEEQMSSCGYSSKYFMDIEKNSDEIICSDEEITNNQNKFNDAEVNYIKKKEEMSLCETKISRIEGQIENAENNYNSLFGTSILPDIDENEFKQPDFYIREHKNIKAIVTNKINELVEEQKKITKSIEECIKLSTAQTEFAQATGIEIEHTNEICEELSDISSISIKINQLKNNLKKNESRNTDYKNKSKITKDRCVKEINELNPDYAYQIDKIEVPDNHEALLKLITDLSTSKELYSDEISGIERSLEEIIEIKNRFTKKCVQKSQHIKTDIDKFAKFSKMYIGDEEIQAVKLSIHYHPEEIQISKMERYIDKIVEDTSKYKDEERRKVLRDKLSGRSLFGVIVNDSSGIELSLYKRERISENSRHLRFEDAVGSTGQSQGIYILLIISIINYISRMYSADIDDKNITKTLFIDNPFGAAKDIYIWEPILSMLRDNNVQIIIPTRGVAPAMTSKFDVYYTLGQKMSGNKMQTVVVNYESKVDNTKIEYTKIDAEQMDLFNMIETEQMQLNI